MATTQFYKYKKYHAKKTLGLLGNFDILYGKHGGKTCGPTSS